MTRRVRFGGEEHQSRESHARHTHFADGWAYYGNGCTVLVVRKRTKRGVPICEVIGEDNLNACGEEFQYSDYFLPEELQR